MPTIIDEFIVTLGLDPKDFRKEADAANKALEKEKNDALKRGNEIERSQKKQRESFSATKNELIGLLGVFTGGMAIKAFIESTIASDAAVGRLSKNIGVSTEEISRWQGVLRATGGTSEDASHDLSLIAAAAQEISLTGTTKLLPFMQLLHLSAEDMKDPTEALLKVADAFAKMDPKQAAYLGQQMGFSPAMISTLQKGRGEVTRLLEEQSRLGDITAEATRKAAAFQTQLEHLKTASKNLGRSILQELIPPLTDLIDLLNTDIAKGDKGLLGGFAKAFGNPWASADYIHRIFPAFPGAKRGPPSRTPAPGAGKLVKSSGNPQFDSDVAYFVRQGWSPAAARGIVAGMWADSGGDDQASNPTGGGQGAHYLAQWRGPRLRELHRQYGPNPTRAQQLAFAHYELTNPSQLRPAGDAIARAAQSGGEDAALEAVIRRFEAPDLDGTRGDLRRGRALLNRDAGLKPIAQNTLHIDNLTIHTQATDARGIARSITPALRDAVAQSDLGLA